MAWSEFEQQTDRALKALPTPEAPSTLVPNVMRAVALASNKPAPWYAQAWLSWPREAQVASLALVAIVAVAFWREGPVAWSWLTAVLSNLRTPAWASTALDTVNRALALGRLPWQFFRNVLLYFSLLALVASLATVASWHAFRRLISEGAPIR
jgi:hypothetical protein